MRKQADFNAFLTKEGRGVYESLKAHFMEVGTWREGFAFELSMLANSMDLYAKNAAYCKENGISQTFESGAEQISPQYTVMKTEYGNVMKHSAKFGLNPADLSRIFNKGEEPKRPMVFDIDTPMRAAK